MVGLHWDLLRHAVGQAHIVFHDLLHLVGRDHCVFLLPHQSNHHLGLHYGDVVLQHSSHHLLDHFANQVLLSLLALQEHGLHRVPQLLLHQLADQGR